MFYSCPHCRELVATDPVTRQSRALCPRCGGALQMEMAAPASESMPVNVVPAAAPTARSLATFLQRNETHPPVQESVIVEAGSVQASRPGSADEHDALAGTPADVISGLNESGVNESVAANAQQQADAGCTIRARDDDAAVDATIPVASLQAEVATAAGTRRLPAMQNEAAAAFDSSEDAAAVDDLDAVSQPDSSRPLPASSANAPSPLREVATPSFTRNADAPAMHARARAWHWAALLVLGSGLMLQVLLADRARLATDAAWRPMMTSLCKLLGCSLPPWRQPEAFAMLGRDVRPLRGTPGALQVQATFRNDADWSQPWPVLLLSLSDADGRVVGARAFRPDEYLEGAASDASATQSVLAPGQSARVVLHLREPAADVVAFSFDFR